MSRIRPTGSFSARKMKFKARMFDNKLEVMSKETKEIEIKKNENSAIPNVSADFIQIELTNPHEIAGIQIEYEDGIR